MTISFKQCNPYNFRSGRTDTIRYIVVHYTANNGDTAKNNVDYFANNAGLQASAHYFVDEREVWQSVRDEDTAWHCGTSGTYRHPDCRNPNSIGVELCSRKDAAGNYYFLEETIDNAVQLIQSLMERYGIGDGGILRHYDVTGKVCPAPYVTDDAAWRGFVDRLSADGEETARDVEVTVGGLKVPAKLIGDTTFVSLRPFVDAMKQELAVTWSFEDGAGVKL